ncbi:PREDICTED: uncharacterized protein LOC104745554 [Camelina sativa]|uniref:Uncharacterized protein LOC104745554 n=1 Tax=Camelina sativa TaxID=90675 RepID=A0ABM0W3D4_CAMSA|nr:PREDICTED: uncharacterized protein LOC104745554 [Camelina sativa]
MYKAFYIFSMELTMAMEITGFLVRISSSLLWFQIYRLGASIIDTSFPRQSDSDLRNSFLKPPLLARQRSRDPELRNSFLEPPAIPKPRSRSDEILGDSAEEPAFYTPLLDGCQSNITTPNITQVVKNIIQLEIYTKDPHHLLQKPLEISLLSPGPWRHLIQVSVDDITSIDCGRKIAYG